MALVVNSFVGPGTSFTRHEPCPECGSRNNLARYADGHAYCFTPGCEYREPPGSWGQPGGGRNGERNTMTEGLLRGEYSALGRRRLTEETCRRWGYMIGRDREGRPVQIAQYRDKRGGIVAQHLRYPDKSMPWVGNPKQAVLFGQHLWGGGKKLVVTEGEIDAMTVSQLQDHKWPVVSVKSGASGAKRDLLANLDYLERFEEIILMFDMDEPGQEAARECAEALLGAACRVKVAQLPRKDANDCLVAGIGHEVIKAIWNASEYAPEEIKPLSSILPGAWEEVETEGVPGPFQGLNKLTHGIRHNELWVIGAGSGTGKSTFSRHFLLHLHKTTSERIGGIFFEEMVQRTTLALVGMEMRKNILVYGKNVDASEVKKVGRDLVAKKEIFLFDAAFSVFDVERLLSRVRYMAKALNCRFIILDHLSYVVEGMDTKDDRKAIGQILAGLRQVMRETGCTIFLVVHLRRPRDDVGFEEGLEPNTTHLRGSQAIEQLADFVLLLSRAKTDEKRRDLLHVRIAKNRFSGEDGVVACVLKYHRGAGLLEELGPDEAARSVREAEEASVPF